MEGGAITGGESCEEGVKGRGEECWRGGASLGTGSRTSLPDPVFLTSEDIEFGFASPKALTGGRTRPVFLDLFPSSCQ